MRELILSVSILLLVAFGVTVGTVTSKSPASIERKPAGYESNKLEVTYAYINVMPAQLQSLLTGVYYKVNDYLYTNQFIGSTPNQHTRMIMTNGAMPVTWEIWCTDESPGRFFQRVGDSPLGSYACVYVPKPNNTAVVERVMLPIKPTNPHKPIK